MGSMPNYTNKRDSTPRLMLLATSLGYKRDQEVVNFFETATKVFQMYPTRLQHATCRTASDYAITCE